MPSSLMKMDEVPPWRAYVCMAFLSEYTDGALCGKVRVSDIAQKDSDAEIAEYGMLEYDQPPRQTSSEMMTATALVGKVGPGLCSGMLLISGVELVLRREG